MKFVDQATIHVKAGSGGHGCIAFLREKNRPKGGPCGGDGGHGGDVILKVDPNLATLHDVSYQRHYKAGRGQHGLGTNKHGKNGEDIIIPVPSGTLARDLASGKILCDLVHDDDTFIIAKGGNGGFGNARFKTHTRTAPRIANDGQPGEEKDIELELKVLADVGLVGFPNAGKSTFLSKVSAARPRIADYPFTTLIPNLGIVKYGAFKSYVIADIPGLIKGASLGKGLGSQFLKHVERTRVLVYLIDGNASDIAGQYKVLRGELENHNPELLRRPSILLLTKADSWGDDGPEGQPLPEDIEIYRISAVSGENTLTVVDRIARLLQERDDPPPSDH
ncbi:MAG: GTPase ObgE [FCB group bacterium]|nr:GTPase ObgE [FCB group bacterium]